MRRFLSGLVGLVGGIITVATIVGIAGGAWWVFDLLANFRLQYALAGLVVALAAYLLNNRVIAVIVLATVGFNAALIAPLYLREPTEAAGPDRLEIISFNVQLSNPLQQLDWILGNEPDFVFLFESSRVAEDLLVDVADGYDVLSGIVEPRNFGATVLARSDLGARIEWLPFADAGGEAVLLEVSFPGGADDGSQGGETVSLIGIHPPSPITARQAELRDVFLEAAGDFLATVEGPKIVTGDFNATPWTHGFRLVSEPSDLVNSQEGYGYSGTWRSNFWPAARIPIDHLLHSRELTVVDREVGPELATDHLPIRVELAWANG